MMNRNRLYYAVIVALLGHLSQAEAQISQGGNPYSFSRIVTDSIATRTMAALDVDVLLSEDALDALQATPVPLRFGQPFEVSLGLDDALRTYGELYHD